MRRFKAVFRVSDNVFVRFVTGVGFADVAQQVQAEFGNRAVIVSIKPL